MFFIKIPNITWDNIPNHAQIIDVRESYEYKSFSYKNAKNIPLSNLNIDNLKGRVYVYCQSGIRSKRAVKYMIRKGIDAVNIRGGLNSYGK